MKNIHVDARTASDIDQRIDRVHRELNYAGGAIELPPVRDLLRLDLQYFRADDPHLLGEVIHKLKIGAKQVIERPGLLLDAIRKFDLNALFIPDRKRILIDGSVPDLKKRWYESHEVAHSLIPWHSDYMLGDDRATLSQGCQQIIEAEANYGAGRLLFPYQAFTEARRSSVPTLTQIQAIAKHFGNTITSTLWRCVEQSEEVTFAAIGEHPHHSRDGKPPIEYFVRSKSFEQRFASMTEAEIWNCMRTYCGYKVTGPLGSAEMVVSDSNGTPNVFIIESFSNRHSVLTMARWLRSLEVQVNVSNKSCARAGP